MPLIYFAQYTSRSRLGYMWGETAPELNRAWLDIFLATVTGQHLFPENGNAIRSDFLGGIFFSSKHNFGVVFRFLNGGRDDVGRSGVVTVNALFFNLGCFYSCSLKGLFEHPQLADPSPRSVSTGIFIETAFPASRFQDKSRYTKPDELYDALNTRYECDTFLLVGHKEGTIRLSPLSQPSVSREERKEKQGEPTSKCSPDSDSAAGKSKNRSNLKSLFICVCICIGIGYCGRILQVKLKSFSDHDNRYNYYNSDVQISIRQDGETPIIQIKFNKPFESMPLDFLPDKGEGRTIKIGIYEIHIQKTSNGIDIKILQLQGDNPATREPPNHSQNFQASKNPAGMP